MLLYKRPIDKKLFVLRLLLTAMFGLAIYSVLSSVENLTYFVSVMFVFLSLIRVKGFKISNEEIKVIDYYFYGLVKKTISFSRRGKININSVGSGFGENADADIVDGETAAGCLISLASVLFIKYKITIKPFTIKEYDLKDEVVKIANVYLTEPEYNLAKTDDHQ